ncbi:MAG: PLP-dependent transferase [Opitutales bacterium]
MSFLTRHPVGVPVPQTPHAVCSSLPTLRDVIGYEEKDPAVLSALQAGYPRFIRHPLVRQATAVAARQANVDPERIVPLGSVAMTSALAAFLGLPETDVAALELPGFQGALLPSASAERTQQAARFLQHTGTGLSSRAAEAFLHAQGVLGTAFEETRVPSANEARATLTACLAQTTSASPDDLALCASGMNAFYALFNAVNAVQSPRGRDLWLQWGWAYVDTTQVLRHFNPAGGESLVRRLNVQNLEALERAFADQGDRIAGVIAEAPTNPLLQCGDCRRLAELARTHGAFLVLDPSTVGLANLRLLPYADAITSSLTKYWANEGDVMAGMVAFNASSPLYDAVRTAFGPGQVELFAADLQRLAHEAQAMPEVTQAINANTRALAQWLESLPEISAVHWAGDDATARHLHALDPDWGPGALITVEVNGPMEPFFDALRLIKGPSFGLRFSLSCPFMFLAHYDQVRTEAGRRELLSQGLNPDLIRLSVGTESQAAIRSAITDSVTALRKNAR